MLSSRRRRVSLSGNPPSTRALVVRVVFYILVLAAVLAFQRHLGQAGATCMAAFEPSGTPDASGPEPAR